MEQHDDFEELFLPIRAKLGQALREQYDLSTPAPASLLELLSQLETSVCVREATVERLYAEIDEGIAALVHAARETPDPREA